MSASITRRGFSSLVAGAFLIVLLMSLVKPCVAAGEALRLQWSYKAVNEVSAVVISENGEYIVAGASTLYFFRRENRDPLWTYPIGRYIDTISITPDARYIALNAADRVYFFDNLGNKLWDARIYEEWQGELTGDVNDVAVSSDGNYVAAVGGYSIDLFSGSGERLWYSYGNPSNPMYVDVVAISGRGERVVCGDRYGAVSVFNTNGDLLVSKDFTTGDEGIADVEISKDGSMIVVLTGDGHVYLLDSVLNNIWEYSLSGVDADMTPDGTLIVVGERNAVYVFSSTSPTPLWQRQAGGVNAVAISPDGQFVSCATDMGVLVYRADGREVGNYPTEDIVESTDVAIGPYVVAGTFTMDILLFSANTPPVLSEPSLSSLVGNENTTFTYRVKYSDPDGDAPSLVQVFIDDVPHAMTGGVGNYITGVYFEFSTTLSVGSHFYYFRAVDNRGAEVRLPLISPDVFSGPVVVRGGEGGGGEGAGAREGTSLPVVPIAAGVLILVVVIILVLR